MSFARTYLRVVGWITIVFGVLYLLVPGSLLDPAGFGAVMPGGVTDVRATYGGFQLGMGAFLLWAAGERGRAEAGVLLVLLSIGAVGSSRAIGLVLDDSWNAFHAAGLATEASLTALSFYVLRRLRRESPAFA